METKKILRGKKVLIVDDEKDILNVLVELLDMCKIDTASSFEEAKQLLETESYDIAVLDIMGVKGFDLLEIANKKGIPALMLTAHALTRDALKESAERGASYFAPKDEISKIDLFVADVLEAVEEKKNPWVRWLERLGSFYDRKFTGPNWREQEREFWDKNLKQFGGM
ncbi:MAG: response regulator receiver protein [Candidatus Altiarchaeales archaeon WOR_SM1_79]|nr:MAG: response regulator receiver protein [Candidatus Altiarchaeales archaeon WOR_SM1_79]